VSRRQIPGGAARAVQGLFKRFVKGFKRKVDDVRRATATPSRTPPSRTHNPHATPRGTRTAAHPTRKIDRALRRENESADALSRHGYDVQQNPAPRWNGKKPDYKIEGRYFDSLAPDSKNIDQVRSGISRKVRDRDSGLLQVDRIVLDLQDSPFSSTDVQDILARKPIKGLREVIVIEGGIPRWLFP
jgi:Contact-dependent growth inhibition CdiA C-terminal domain